jgi:hypothetical protein
LRALVFAFGVAGENRGLGALHKGIARQFAAFPSVLTV